MTFNIIGNLTIFNFLLIASTFILTSSCVTEKNKLEVSGSFKDRKASGIGENILTSLPVLTSIDLTSPIASPGNISTPEITISDVVDTALVEIFSDSSCSSIMGSQIAAGTSVNITSQFLLAGNHSFYAKQTIGTVSSDCSIVKADYIYDNIEPQVLSILRKVSEQNPTK